MAGQRKTVLVTGASGFVGRALVPALIDAGHEVRGLSRHPPARERRRVEWFAGDVADADSLTAPLAGVDATYYLVHGLGTGRSFEGQELLQARTFASAAASAGVGRIIFLGGVAPKGRASPHLSSRLAVGAALRAGKVPCLELRASMIVGEGSTSWKVVRDLALRLPGMVLPAWLSSRTRPIAIEDVVLALLHGLEVPLPASACFDLPGPDVLSGREILMRVAALRGRRVPTIEVPFVTPRLSALWLRVVTGADYAVARELVLGLEGDLLPEDERYFALTHHPPRIHFDDAVRATLGREERPRGLKGTLATAEELAVDLFGPRLRPEQRA